MLQKRRMTFDSDIIKLLQPRPIFDKIVEEETEEHMLAKTMVDTIIRNAKISLLKKHNNFSIQYK